MNTLLKKGFCIFLLICTLLPMTGCEEKQVTIECRNAVAGMTLCDITVSVLCSDTVLKHTATWHVAKGDERHEMAPDDALGVGYYELSIRYTMPGEASVPVTANCGAGELIHTEKLGDGAYLAVIGFYFSEEPTTTEGQEPTATKDRSVITINCGNAAAGTALGDVAVSVLYGDTPLDHTIEWSVGRNDELYPMAPEDALGPGHYELRIIYTVSLPHETPIIGNCSPGQLIYTAKLDEDRYVAIVSFDFAGEPAPCSHQWSVTGLFGTCPEGLHISYQCGLCQEKTAEILEPKNHDYTLCEFYDGDCHIRVCDDCGQRAYEGHIIEGSKCIYCGMVFTAVAGTLPGNG